MKRCQTKIKLAPLQGARIARRVPVVYAALRPPATFFVTAYDQYAVRAFEVQALDYLLKPFDQERFDVSWQRAKALLHFLSLRAPHAIHGIVLPAVTLKREDYANEAPDSPDGGEANPATLPDLYGAPAFEFAKCVVSHVGKVFYSKDRLEIE